MAAAAPLPVRRAQAYMQEAACSRGKGARERLVQPNTFVGKRRKVKGTGFSPPGRSSRGQRSQGRGELHSRDAHASLISKEHWRRGV